MNTADIIAIYAAGVSTAVAGLQFRQWLLSGPRLAISVMPEAKIYGGTAEQEAGSYIAVTVTNRGTAPTTILSLSVVERPSLLPRRRRAERMAYLIPNPQTPGTPPNTPHVLEPDQQWRGLGPRRSDIPALIELLNSGNAYASVQASHRDKPFLKRIPKPAKAPQG